MKATTQTLTVYCRQDYDPADPTERETSELFISPRQPASSNVTLKSDVLRPDYFTRKGHSSFQGLRRLYLSFRCTPLNTLHTLTPKLFVILINV